MSNPSHLNFNLTKVVQHCPALSSIVQQKELKIEGLYINRIYDVIKFFFFFFFFFFVLNLKLSISFDRDELKRYLCLAEV